jgi:hypothetical protein
MSKQPDLKRLLKIVLGILGAVAFAVGVRGGWTLGNDYFEHKDQGKVSRPA